MLNIINKSVKTINSGISTLVNGITSEKTFDTEIDFCKFETLPLEHLKVSEKETENRNQYDYQNLKEFNVLYIVHSKMNLNIYHITDDLEIKCFMSLKFNFPVCSVNSFKLQLNTSYSKELPIIAIISNNLNNSNNQMKLIDKETQIIMQKNESFLKLYSIKSKRIIHSLRFKKKILEFNSTKNYFAISFADGNIKLYDSKMVNFIKILTIENKLKLSKSFKECDKKKSENSYYLFSIPIFDITDTYIISYVCNNDKRNLKNYFKSNNNIHSQSKENGEYNSNKTSTSGIKFSHDEEKLKLIGNSSNELINKNLSGKIIKNGEFQNYENFTNFKNKQILVQKNIDKNHMDNDYFIKHDSTNDFLIHSSYHENEKESNRITPTIENLAINTFKNISKLKDWSLSQLKEFSNLRNASNLNNNSRSNLEEKQIQKLSYNSCTLKLHKFFVGENHSYSSNSNKEEREGRESNKSPENERVEIPLKNSLNSNSISLNQNSDPNSNLCQPANSQIHSQAYNINVPFFEDGISLIKIFSNGRYFLVGNKNSQMFYLYDLFQQSNLKYTKEYDSSSVTPPLFNFNISYSIYRGVTSASINTVDISKCRNFIVIGSNKGTFHVFNLPKKDNQIYENCSNFQVENFDEFNNKIICAKNIEKIKLGNFLFNYTYKTTCKIINYNKIEIEKNFSHEMKENLMRNKLIQSIKGSVLYTLSENDLYLHVYFLHKNFTSNLSSKDANKSVYLMKKLEINLTNNEEIQKNYNELTRIQKHVKFQQTEQILNSLNGNFNLNSSNLSKMKSFFKDFIELETTDNNFPSLHLNPLFNFNILNKSILNNGIAINLKQYNSGSNSKELRNSKLYSSNKIIEEKNESEVSPSPNSSLNRKEKYSKKNIDKDKLHTIKNEQVINFTIQPMVNTNNRKISTQQTIRSRSNSISLNKFNLANNINGLSNSINQNLKESFLNDVIVHEKVTCPDFNYAPKLFSNDRKNTPTTDFHSDPLVHSKLLVYPSNYMYHHKMKRNLNRKNTSISDNSSSVENSISLTGINVIYENHHTDPPESGRDLNNSSHFNQRDLMIKHQLKKDIESNIVDNIKKNVDVVKIVAKFSIDENYYVNK